MEDADIAPLLSRLGKNVTDLEDTLNPLIQHALSERARQLPLLDRAKLYTLVVYAIESLIFSYLSLHGVKAAEHPVYRELTRVKQYFTKIKLAETGLEKPNMQLDKAAADRFIKHALAGNNAPGHSTEKAEPGDASKPDTPISQKRKLGDGQPIESKSTPSGTGKAKKKKNNKKI